LGKGDLGGFQEVILNPPCPSFSKAIIDITNAVLPSLGRGDAVIGISH
jgi:hypothetical protein